MTDAPDFFLVGAPKAATSSLYVLLIQHPEIFMCRPKEPHFFSTDLPGLAEVADREGYDALFAEAPDNALRGEASAHYLASTRAAEEIYKANPDAKIILSIRHPAAAARSYYHQLRDGFREDRQTFEEAWDLQDERAQGRSLPPYCPEPQQLQYRMIYSYSAQVARYLEIFPREQIMILLFDEFARAPKDVVERVFKFLGVPDLSDQIELPRTNTRRVSKFPALTQLVAAPPAVLRPFVAPAKKVLNAVGVKPSEVMMKHLSRPQAPGSKKPSGDQLRSDIIASFADDIDRLESLLDIDLSAWRH